MKLVPGRRRLARVALLALAIGAVLLVAGVLDATFAQSSPFGMPRGQGAVSPAAPVGGVLGWIFTKQAEFYRQFSSLIRASKSDGTAAWSLLALAFVYGAFHAAGPGHGKAVISSYLVANEETWRRGVVLSFASAMVQALVAVLIVGIAAALLNATAATMGKAVNLIETLSYGLIVLIGLRLFWVKGRAFLATLRQVRSPKAVGAAVTPAHLLVCDDHDHHDHVHHDHSHHDHAHCGHDHHHHHAHGCCDHEDHASAWGHSHAPEPEELAGPGGWRRGLSAVVAVGARPCSGAIILLVFALAQGLFWTGVAATFVMGVGTALTVAAIATVAVGAKSWASQIAATRSGYGMLAMRGIEAGGAALIIAFGALLLAGYMVSERLVGF